MLSGAALRRAIALASVLLAPWVLRTVGLLEDGLVPQVSDLRGYLADLAMSLVLLGPLWLIARVARSAAVALVLALVLLRYASYETVRALGTVVALSDAGYLADETFLVGSALAVSQPVLLAGLVVASGALAWWGLEAASGREVLWALVSGALLLASLPAWPEDPRLAGWRQVEVLEQNARWLTLSPGGSDGSEHPPDAMLALLPELGGDLTGTPRFEWSARPRNVLLVMLEGMSGGFLTSVANTHGRHPILILPELDALARENLSFTTLVDHQRKTNRGTYALLCGELPRLLVGTAKMTAAVRHPWRTCLPEILRGAGYHTVYLQAAPLAFMLKGRFLPKIGFDQVHGDDWFQHHYHRSRWGVDDRAFFEQALELVETLRSGERPWFLTLLTVGTHHPYLVPEEAGQPRRRRRDRPEQRIGSRDRAFAYLDSAVGDFIENLEKAGVREDTLVLLVSDESAGGSGAGRATSEVARILADNWGIAIALLPERVRGRVDAPYAQMDVALTILDYLGLAEHGGELFGRSLFREYPSPRHLFFGNVNRRTVGALGPDGRAVVCRYDGGECGTYELPGGHLFSPVLPEAPEDEELTELVRRMARASAPAPRERLDLSLGLRRVLPVESEDWQIIHGGQMVSLEPGEWIEVDLEVATRGRGGVGFEQTMRLAGAKWPLLARAELRGGQRLRLHYTLTAGASLPQVEVRSLVRRLDAEPMEIVLERRRFAVHRSGTPPPHGVHVDAFEIEPPDSSGSPTELLIEPPSVYERPPARPEDA